MIKMALSPNFWNLLKVCLTVTEDEDPVTHWINDCDGLFQDTKLLQTIKNSHFDFAIVDGIYPFGFYALAYKFDIPYAMLSIPVAPLTYRIPHLSSQVPNIFLLSGDKMSFFTRLLSFMMDMLEYVSYAYYRGDFINKYVQEKKFLSNLELIQAAKLSFQIYDPVLRFPRPKMPNVVFVGDIMARKSQELSEDLTKLLNSAKDGAVVVSLGTMIESLPVNLTNILYDALGQIKYLVIMKKAGIVPANLAKNIHLLEWIPQNDLLGHKNVKLFITHCGLNSVIEAVYHGVPIVGLPLAYDQPFNAFALDLKGYGKQLKWGDFKAKDLKEAIEEVLGNPVFGEKAKHMSMSFRDKMDTPAERVSFWIDHVLQHGDGHLRTKAFNLNLFQFLMWDVYLFLLLVLIISLIFTFYFTKLCCRCLCKCCCSEGQKLKEE